MTRNKYTPSFPGDPRFSPRLDPLKEDVEALGKKEMLSTCLLNCLLQRAAPPQESGYVCEFFHVCGLMGREYIGSANAWSEELSDHPIPPVQQTCLTGNIKKLRIRLAKTFQIDKEV